MFADLLAGTSQTPITVPSRSPSILAFASGLGGLPVFSEHSSGLGVWSGPTVGYLI